MLLKTDFFLCLEEVHLCYFTELLDAQLEKTGRDVNQRHGELNETALHIAAQKGLLEAAKWLIVQGADLEATDIGGRTPLYEAAFGDYVDVASLLIDRGAKVDAKNTYGETPLHRSASWNSLKVARLLINKGADKNAENIHGDKPIDYARQRGHSEMIALLQ